MNGLEQLFQTFQTFLSEHPFLAALLSLVSLQLVEISPIKLAPFTWLKKKIAKNVKYIISIANQETNDAIADKMDELTTKIDETNVEVLELKNNISDVKTQVCDLKSHNKKEKALDLRREILNFGDDVADGKAKSKRNYERILFNLYPKYEKLIEELGLTNGQVDDSYHYLLKKYHENISNGSFKKFYGDDYEMRDQDIDIEQILTSLEDDNEQE